MNLASGRGRFALRLGLVLVAALLAWAYQGPLQRGLDLWTAGRTGDALAEFRRLESGDASGLARLNRLVVEGEQALASSDVQGRKRTLVRVSGELAALAGGGQKTNALFHAGRFALAGGDSARGLKWLEQAYRQQPKRQILANHLLQALLNGKELSRLREIATHQVDLRPDNPFAWYALGEAERRGGMPKRALLSWNRGIEIFPLRPMLESAIVLAQKQGRADLIRAWLEVLRLRYASSSSGKSLGVWCDSLGLASAWNSLPAEQETRRYQDRFPEFFPVGREWTYKVRYGIIPLGVLKVGVRRRDEIQRQSGKQEAWRVYYKIESNPAYRMIINIQDVYEALIPSHCLHSAEFVLRSREGAERSDRVYSFDTDNMRFLARGYHAEGDVFREELPLARQVFDGLSLLFAARRQVREGRYGTVLTIVDEEVHRTVIQYDGRGQIRVQGKARKVVNLHGKADYQGIAGLTGEFWGQFSDDREALPLTARFQIKLGKISLELDEVADGVAK
jgi:tetratricopeptide (TPR) repeat protein